MVVIAEMALFKKRTPKLETTVVKTDGMTG